MPWNVPSGGRVDGCCTDVPSLPTPVRGRVARQDTTPGLESSCFAAECGETFQLSKPLMAAKLLASSATPMIIDSLQILNSTTNLRAVREK